MLLDSACWFLMDVWIEHAKAVQDCDLDISQAQVSFLFQSLLEDNCHMAAGTLQITFEIVSAKEPVKIENIDAVLS